MSLREWEKLWVADCQALRELDDSVDEDERAFEIERLGLSAEMNEVVDKPIFLGERMKGGGWRYDRDVEGGAAQGLEPVEFKDYTSFNEINRGLVRVIRRDPVLKSLVESASHVIISSLKEGSHHGIYKVSFLDYQGEEIIRVLSVSKSVEINDITRLDAKRLHALSKTNKVPMVYGVGELPIESGNVYVILEFLPCHEISLHKGEDEDREFQFLEGGDDSPHVSTNVPHDVMGNKMMETVFEVMFSDEEALSIPQMLRGDLVWVPDQNSPEDSEKGKVMLISTANALTLLDHPYYQRQLNVLGRCLRAVGAEEHLLDSFSMLSALNARWDSESIDRFYHDMAVDHVAPDELDPAEQAHVVYPYDAQNIKKGLLSAQLDDVAFERAFFALYFALRVMTDEGRKRRTNKTLTGLCSLYDALHLVWVGAAHSDVDLRQALLTLGA